MLGMFPMKSNTHMVVMELVSQQLDEYRNNGVISKLTEFLSGEIWVWWIVGFLLNYGCSLASKTVRESTRYLKEYLYKLAWKLDVIW